MKTPTLVTDVKRILLVGASSRVGQMITHHWKSCPPANLVITEQHRDKDRNDGVYWSLLDGNNTNLTANYFDAIISLAGVTPSVGADLSQNVLLSEAVLSAAQKARIPRVLIASSSAVYGLGNGTSFSEESATNPINLYGQAKLEMEKTCPPWRVKGINICCLRIGNVAGADALLQNALHASSDTSLSIDRYADGRGPLRSYIGPKTMGHILADLAVKTAPLPNILNIAAPNPVYMEDLAQAAGHSFKFQPKYENEYQNITLDCQRLMQHYSFEAGATDPKSMVKQWKETLIK